MLKKTCLILVSILMLAAISGECSAQKIAAIPSSDYTGLWFGGSAHLVNGKNQLSMFLWKIHKIDNVKREIELTELMKHFDDSTEIENPVRRVYKGFANKDGLEIELKTVDRKSLIVKLKAVLLEENSTLQSRITEDKYYFNLTRISRDTTNYVKPKVPIKVEIIRSGILE